MSGTNEELDVAHEALLRARDDLARELDAEPAWRALKQLDAREASGEPATDVDFAAIRANLVARLDAAIPHWRTLAGIDAAIAALGTSTQGGARPRPGLPPPPIPASSVPHARIEPERTRYASQARPTPVVPLSNGRRGAPPIMRKPSKEPEISGPSAPPRRGKSAGGRLAAALGLVNDGPARLSAIESEVERLMRRDAGTWEKPPSPAPRPARFTPPHPEPVEAPPSYGEEAEVEIVLLTPTGPQRDERRPMTKLSDRLSRLGNNSDQEPRAEPIVSMHAHLDEADVEVEIEIDQPKAIPVPAARPENDTSEI